jgi:hypothetical protein
VSRSSIVVESFASTHVVVVQRSVTRPAPRRAAHGAPQTAAPPQRHVPRPPLAPSGPDGPAAGSAGSSPHGGGASVLTAAAVAALALVALPLLSSLVPLSLPVRRRLSDDRQARPG